MRAVASMSAPRLVATAKQKPQAPKAPQARTPVPAANAPPTPLPGGPWGSKTPTTPKPPVAAGSQPQRHAPLTPGVLQRAVNTESQVQRTHGNAHTPAAASGAAGEQDGAAPAPPSKPPPLRNTLEAYFSNEGLSNDRYLRELVAESAGGWVDIEVILGLKRVRALRAKREDVLHALQGSWLETCVEPDGSFAGIRRPPSRGRVPECRAAPVAHGVAGLEEAGSVAADVTRVTPQRWLLDAVEAPSNARRRPEPEPEEAQAPKKARKPESPAKAAPQSKVTPAGGRHPFDKRRLTGVVETFNLRLGLGKIKCAELGCSVGVAVADLAGFDVGDSVSFLTVTDPKLGIPRAQNLEAYNLVGEDDADEEAKEEAQEAPEEEAEEEEEQEPPKTPARTVATPRVARPAQPAGQPRARPPAPVRPPALPAAPGSRLTGVVGAINARAGVGTIKCAEGSIVKARVADLAGFEAGDEVCFTLSAAGEATELEAA